MATGRVSGVARRLRQALLRHDEAGLSDGQLLGLFVEKQDEAAFAGLVRQHGPMVWGVCRRALAHHQDAEDAFQAAFLVLARKAKSVVPREAVGNWLHGVAYNTAVKARATAARRNARERQVADVPEPEAVTQDPWNGLQPLLDQELSRLPDQYRLPVVLCDLGGKTRKEAARQLGWPEGTVSSRLSKARAMLARGLARHGLPLSGAALGAVLGQDAGSGGVPPSVMSSTIKAAIPFAAGQAATGVVPARVAALTDGVLKAMLLSKLKVVTAGLAAVILSVVVGVVTTSAPAQAPAPGGGDQKQEAKVKWEYKAIPTGDIENLAPRASKDRLTDGLNALGDDGWELVAVQPGVPVLGGATLGGGTLGGGPTPTNYVFKRPK
jgi:RNA polymerase sigma factor (sigma-70 family)